MTGEDILVVGGGALTVGDDTSMVNGCTLMVGGGTLTASDGTFVVGDCTLTIGGGTQTVDGNTLTVGDGTLIGHDQHRVGGTIASMTQQHHHQYDSMVTSCHGQH
jgi:hypothetical protein